MAQRSTTQLKALYGTSGTIFPDNTTQEISEADMRGFGEDLADSMYNKADNPELATGITTREFNRAWSSELLFDKNVIHYAPATLTEDTTFTINTDSDSFQQDSVIIQEITTDGTHAVFFETYDPFGGVGFKYIPGNSIQSGDTPEAGTYAVMFMKFQSFTMAHWVVPSSEAVNLDILSAPANLEAVADGNTKIDITWDAVANAASYELQYSLAGGGGPWSDLATPASGDTAYEHTGLSAGTTVHYRLRAIGDGETYANSQYSVTAGTSGNSGDVDEPEFVFNPLDAATGIPVNQALIITSDKPLQKADGTPITDPTEVIETKEDDDSGSAIPSVPVLDVTQKIFTVTPNPSWGANQAVYAEVDGVEDDNGIELSSPATATFTTNSYTIMGTNELNLGNQIDSYLAGDDKKWEIWITFKGFVSGGYGTIVAKYLEAGNQRSFFFRNEGPHIQVKWYADGSNAHGRQINWMSVLNDQSETTLRLIYDGTIDTNNGLDRFVLRKNGVVVAPGGLIVTGTATWPFGIYAGTADVRLLRVSAQMKDFIFKADTGGGMVDIVNIPVIRTGEDTSGNNLDGTWV